MTEAYKPTLSIFNGKISSKKDPDTSALFDCGDAEDERFWGFVGDAEGRISQDAFGAVCKNAVDDNVVKLTLFNLLYDKVSPELFYSGLSQLFESGTLRMLEVTANSVVLPDHLVCLLCEAVCNAEKPPAKIVLKCSSRDLVRSCLKRLVIKEGVCAIEATFDDSAHASSAAEAQIYQVSTAALRSHTLKKLTLTETTPPEGAILNMPASRTFRTELANTNRLQKIAFYFEGEKMMMV
jgi:hypothetical protein